MKQIYVVATALLLLGGCGGGSNSGDTPATNARLLFKSGFEAGVYIDPVLVENNEIAKPLSKCYNAS